MTSAESIRRPQLSEEIAAHIREAVMAGQLRPGQFVRLDAMANQLGTSVTPVREALLLLRGEGMVRLIPRRGYVVSPLSRLDVEDLFELQAHIGAEIVARATAKISVEEIEQLATMNRQLLAAVRSRSRAEIERLEFAFHRTINVAAGSRKLAYMLNNATRYLPAHFFSADIEWRTSTAGDHKAILDALQTGDVEAAQVAVVRHVLDGKQRLLTHLDSIDFWAPPTPEASLGP
jgi:DNA-binding GntR family transcriptional regulator